MKSYVACRRITLPNRIAERGDHVQEANGWTPIVLRAHLNQGFLEEGTPKVASGQSKRAKARKGKAECHGRTTQSKRTRTKSGS